ncbi:MAG: hypothetical protein ACXWXZ_20685, partial [Candidatus Binatia bacterium]
KSSLGLALAKTQRPQRSENNREKILHANASLPSELGVFAPLREIFPESLAALPLQSLCG